MCRDIACQADETIFMVVGAQMPVGLNRYDVTCAEMKPIPLLLHRQTHLAAILLYSKLFQHIHAE